MYTLKTGSPVNNEIEGIAKSLIESVKLTLEVTSTFLQRQQAFENIEKIKEDYKFALPCGFFLSSSDDPTVKHLGLQLLENTIKYHWNEVQISDKLQIKNSSMELLAKGTDNLSAEHIYIKDKISRLVVEMIKREWPQQWPNLLVELSSVAEYGPTQAELVLLILLRLAEDVECLENAYNRRRDLYLALSSNMDFLFNLFMNLLEIHYKKYKELQQQHDQSASIHCRVTQVIYMTLSGFVEWVPMVHITTHQQRLFFSICLLLQDENIRQSAAECFLRIVSKKSDWKHLLILFDKEVMEAIISAARTSVSDELSEANYLFLKTLFQVLITLGTQLCLLWNKEPDTKEPLTFGIFLHSLLEFMRHPSLSIYHYCNPLMLQLLRTKKALKNNAFIEMIPHWIPVALSKIKKNGFPTNIENVESKYSALDFDGDVDYTNFYVNVKNCIVVTIKEATLSFPEICFSNAEECLLACLESSFESNLKFNTLYPTTQQIEWEAIAIIMDAVLTRLPQSTSFNIPIERIKIMTEKCLQYEIENPKIENAILSTISALCTFLPKIPEVTNKVLCKIFSTFRNSLKLELPNSLKSDNREFFHLRNHACAFLVKVCKLYSKELVSSFDFISDSIKKIPDLVASESGILLQAQILLLNEYNNFETEQAILGKLVLPYCEQWLSISASFNDYFSLIKFLGLNAIPSEKNCDIPSTLQENRNAFWKSMSVIFYLTRTVSCPSDKSVAKEGGFLVNETENGFVCRNPGAIYVQPLLESLFNLIKTLNSLTLPEALALHSNEYSKAHEIPVAELKNYLNLHTQDNFSCLETKEEPGDEKMRIFLKNVYEQTCRIIGNIGPMMPLEFYQISHLPEIVIQTVLSNWSTIPDFKIRCVLKGFYRPFIFSCPSLLHESVLLPVIHNVTLIMLNHLNMRWEYISKVMVSDGYDEDATDTKEMIDLTVLQVITRDYIEIVREMLICTTKPVKHKGGQDDDINENVEENKMDDVEVCPPENKLFLGQPPYVLSPLGRLMFRCDPICQALVLTFCSALSWYDSIASRKANQCLQLCLRSLFEEGQHLLNEDAVKHILMAILSGIHTQGKDEINLNPLVDTAIMFFEKLSPHFPIIRTTLLSSPAVNMQDLVNFENCLSISNPGSSESHRKRNLKESKFKRDAFKKVIHNVISKSLSEAFQREVHIKDLAPIFKRPRNKQPRLDEGSSNMELCKLFDPSA